MLPVENKKWRDLTVLAIDKSTVALPESEELYKKFGAHNGSRGLGSISVEICCLFSVFCRIPIAVVFGKSSTSEHLLIPRLLKHVKKLSLLLIDNGFYSCTLFKSLIEREINFIIPTASNYVFKLTLKLANGDYLSSAYDRKTKTHIPVRVIFVYRKGFRRKRLVSSLLDPQKYPASEIADLYHLRWDIETFYNEFKNTMQGSKWHCRNPHSFEIELISKMIFACLVRHSGCQAAQLSDVAPGRISFSRTVSAVKRFMKTIVIRVCWDSFENAWNFLIKKIINFYFQSKPGRSYHRDKQEYRKDSRKKRRGRPKSPEKIVHGPETKEFSTTLKKGVYILT